MELLKNVMELQTLMDDETYSHCCRLKNAAVSVSRGIGLDAHLLGNACAVLDIGKLLINEYVFHKAERLSQTERELMDLHPYLGYKICLENDIPGEVAEIVLYHHGEERPHLSKTPGLTEEIKAYAQAARTIDAYEALREERGYRSRYTKEEAYAIMEKEAGREHYRMDVLELLYDMDL